MNLGYVLSAALLSVILAGSAWGKLVKAEPVTTGLGKAEVPLSWYLSLALVELTAVIGLLIGIAWRPLGILAAIGTVLYFIGAVLAHLRAKDVTGAQSPATLLTLSAVVLGFGLASA